MVKPRIFAFFVALILFPVLDFLWIGVIARNFYRAQLGTIMLTTPRIGVAAAFYVIYASGLCLFAIFPALEEGTALRAMVGGALLGFLCYATYDLSNLATLEAFSWPVVLVDMLWGTLLSALVAGVATMLARQSWAWLS